MYSHKSICQVISNRAIKRLESELLRVAAASASADHRCRQRPLRGRHCGARRDVLRGMHLRHRNAGLEAPRAQRLIVPTVT